MDLTTGGAAMLAYLGIQPSGGSTEEGARLERQLAIAEGVLNKRPPTISPAERGALLDAESLFRQCGEKQQGEAGGRQEGTPIHKRAMQNINGADQIRAYVSRVSQAPRAARPGPG
jgi:hypothetical protein